MAIGSADLMKAIVTIWNASGLNDQFKSYWSTQNQSEFIVIQDAEAEPKQPFPYCIFEVDDGRVVCRMSGVDPQTKLEIREHDWNFVVQARDMADGFSAKETASRLAESIMAVFGGHPTIAPKFKEYPLDNGYLLNSQYQTDFGTRQPTRENFAWNIKYSFRLDVPVAI